MKPCFVGIGGAGGKVLRQFLQSEDLDLKIFQFGKPLAFGNVRGVWLESAIQDAEGQHFYRDLSKGNYPGYLICHGIIDDESDTNGYLMDTYGLNLKAHGYDRRAEYLKSVFEILDFDPVFKDKCLNEFKGYQDPLFDYMWKNGIKQFVNTASRKPTESDSDSEADAGKLWRKSLLSLVSRFSNGNCHEPIKQCDSILFLASLGGGTGTGFINPITSYVRKEKADFPIFALCILTEKGSDDRHAKEGKRDLGATIAMQDLLTQEAGTGIDGLILVDNQILVELYAKDFPAMDMHIQNSLKPLLDTRNYPGYHLQDDAQAIRGIFRELNIGSEGEKKLFPPLLVPCSYQQPDYEGNINTLVEGALGIAGSLFPLGKDGRLFSCDPTKADRALVFTRGFFDEEEIAEAVAKCTHLSYEKIEGKIEGKIKIYRKLGDSKNEDILILLRNPYGDGTANEHTRKGTLEWRFHEVILEAIKYIDENKTNILEFDYKPNAKEKLEKFFYGENGIRNELNNCLDRLENGDGPVFRTHLWTFRSRDKDTYVPDSCIIKPEILAGDKYDLKEMINSQLREILKSDDCKKRIKALLQS